MSCEEMKEELLPLYPDDLEADEATRVRDHVAACAPCATLLAQYAADRAACAAWGEGRRPPAGLLDGLADAAIAVARERERRRGPVILRLFAAALTGAAAAAALVLAWGRFSAEPASAPTPSLAERPRAVAPAAPGLVEGPRAIPVSNGGDERRARDVRDALKRFFRPLDEVQVVPAAGGDVRRVPYDSEATLPSTPGTEYRQNEAEPAAPHAPRSVSF